MVYSGENDLFSKAVERAENIQAHASLKQPYRSCYRNIDCDQQEHGEANRL